MQDTSSEVRGSTSGWCAFLVLVLIACTLASACTCDANEQGHLLAPPGGDLSHGPAVRQHYDLEIVSQCGSHGLQGNEPKLFTRRPYLQRVDSSSATIVWTSASDALVLSVEGPGGSDAQRRAPVVDTSAAPQDAVQYLGELSGLTPGSVYCYSLHREDDDSAVFRGGFRTAPNADATVRFSAFGDLGKDSPDQHAVLRSLQSVDSEFLLVMGDVAYDRGTLAQLESHFFAVYAEYLALVPVFPATGNHDYATDLAAAFREAFVLPLHDVDEGHERWYSFDWGPVHVAVLDTEVLLEQQAAWLRDDMQASELPWKIVSLHKPPYSSGGHGSEAEVQDVLVPVFVETNVDLVLAGHDHHYERSHQVDGVHYVVSGGGGRGTRPVGSSDFTAYAARVAHFVYLVADPTTLHLHAIDGTGQEFDTLKLEH